MNDKSRSAKSSYQTWTLGFVGVASRLSAQLAHPVLHFHKAVPAVESPRKIYKYIYI